MSVSDSVPRRRILSIDVGIKNLALCYLETGHDAAPGYRLLAWEVMDLSQPEPVPICQTTDCAKPAQYLRGEAAFCTRHAKKQTWQVPPPALRMPLLQKNTLADLVELATQYQIPYAGKRKKDWLQAFQNYLDSTCFTPLERKDASKESLITLGHHLKHQLNRLFRTPLPLPEVVLIENQLSPLASRMKTLQGMLAQYFIMQEPTPPDVVFVAASQKLKDCEAEQTCDYKTRKKTGVAQVQALLKDHGAVASWQPWQTVWSTSTKKDDLADALLQALGWMHHLKQHKEILPGAPL